MKSMFPPHLSKIAYSTIFAVALLFGNSTHAGLMTQDEFTDGGRTNGADPLDVPWYSLGVAGSALAIVDDSAGIGSGNGVKLTPTATFQGFVANLPSGITLADGESLTLSFTWRFAGAANINQSGRLRFGVYNAGGTLATSDNTTATSNDVGYCGYTNPGLASSSGTALARETAGDFVTMGSNFVAIGSAGTSFNAATNPYDADLTITRNGSTLNISVRINGVTAASALDAAPLTYTFNELAFSIGSGLTPSPLIIDNVQVERTATQVDDGFTDGDRTNGTDAFDIPWYLLGVPNSFQVADDTAGIGYGNALSLKASATYQGMQGILPWCYLGDGDSLIVSFDWRFAGTTGLNEAGKLRFGLHSSGGTLATADNIWNIANNDAGYFAGTNPGSASSTGTTLFREPSGDAILSGANNTIVGSPGASISAGTIKHTANMTISRSGNSLLCSTSIDGLAPASGTDTLPSSYSFEELSARLVGSTTSPQFLIDNVKFNHTQLTTPLPEGPPAGTWNLVLDEQFNGTTLNGAIWSRGYRWADVINNELQAMRPENVTVADGFCTIKVEKRTARNRDMYGFETTNMAYASGTIQSYNKWATTYGYIEARLKMPAGKGTWPAFWLLPDRGTPVNDVYYRVAVGSKVFYPSGATAPCPMGNEIDIFEHMGSWKNPTTGLSKLHCNLHWGYPASTGGYANMNGVSGNYILQNPDTQFHNYGLYWAPGIVVFYVDGKVVMRRDHPNVGVCPHYLLLNCAISTNDWTGTPVSMADIDAGLPSNMVIDYVRVYSGTPSVAP